MFRPDHEYQCLLGVYNPLNKRFHPDHKIDNTFSVVTTRPSDVGGCLGCTSITTFIQSPVKAILVARPFRQGGEAVVRYKVNGVYTIATYPLYDNTLETPRLIWLPDNVENIVFNIRVEDMGYEPSWYEDQNNPITDDCDLDFINTIGLYFMYDASPYYSKLELVKERDSQATSGRFLRDKVTTDLTFRGLDFDRLVSGTEYDVCAVAFYERFEEQPQQDYLAACCYFNRADAEVNFSECYIKPNLKTLDNYSWLLDKYSVEKNIVGIQATTQEVSIPIPPVIQLYIYGSDTVTNICNDTCWEQEVGDTNASIDELRKMGFYRISARKIQDEMPVFYDYSCYRLSLAYQPFLSESRYIHYDYNSSTREYQFTCTSDNYTEPATDEFPYDMFRFRLRNGVVECYDPRTERIFGSRLYNGGWPAEYEEISFGGFVSGLGHNWNLGSSHLTYWGLFEATPILIRILCHSDTETDLYAIGDFAFLSKWYNKLAYGVPSTNYQWYEGYDIAMPPLIGDSPAVEAMFRFYEDNTHVKKPTEYGNYQPDSYYTNENLPSNSYLQGLKPLPFGKSWWGEYSFWVDLVGNEVQDWLNGFTTRVKIKDCFTLDSVIKRLLNSYGLGFEFSNTYVNSRLLYGQANVPNYLKCLYSYLIPATNITRGKYTQAAQKSMLSLKDLLDEICTMCNAGWHIDRDGLHIEGNEWYDAGHSYSSIVYSPNFDFESVIDEFNNTNTLYGQIASAPDVDDLWHTLSMGDNDMATKHFANTEMTAKALFCKKDDSISQKFAYDLLEAIAVEDGVDDDSIIMLGIDAIWTVTINGVPHTTWLVNITSTSIIEATTLSVSGQVQARIMNKAYSWPYLKGRHMFRLPADKSLIDFGWLQVTEYFSTLAKAYTKPHRTIKIRMPIVSALYTENWQLVKTTLGYGVISRVDIDLITRVATMTVDILEYNLP